jgi:hypothetical protein
MIRNVLNELSFINNHSAFFVIVAVIQQVRELSFENHWLFDLFLGASPSFFTQLVLSYWCQ